MKRDELNVSALIATEKTDKVAADRWRKPVNAGVYFFKEVSLLLRATDHQARADVFALSPQQITGWANKGFAQIENDAVFSHHRYIRFPDVITLRMVAILRSYGISLKNVSLAYEFLADALSTTHPFVDRRLWVDDTEVAEDIYAEIDDMLVTASRHGQRPFTDLLTLKIVDVANLTFDDANFAATWSPHSGVVIDPLIHSGAPCISGTRIATEFVYNMHMAGDVKSEIADWYELRIDQVESAIDWEERLAA